MLIHSLQEIVPESFGRGIVGALVPAWEYTNYRCSIGGKEAIRRVCTYLFAQRGPAPSDILGQYWCVIEADEFADHCLYYRPEYTLITNIVHDHTDYFPTRESYLTVFRSLCVQTRK